MPVRRKALQTRKRLQRNTELAKKRGRPRRVAGTYQTSGIPTAIRTVVHERSGGWCEIRLDSICTGRAAEIHHRKRRREGGHPVSNLAHACPACHDWVTNNPAEGRRLHWIVSVFEDPADVRVPITMHDGQRRGVLLLEDGSYSDGEPA